jgi:hypothetical protein
MGSSRSGDEEIFVGSMFNLIRTAPFWEIGK